MEKTWIVKILSGTVARGIMWAIAGICAYLSAKGIAAEAPDPEAVTAGVAGVVAFVLPIVASWWSSRKDRKLLATEPPLMKK